jgi:tellurite resistance protein TerC
VANSGLVRATRRFFPVTDNYDGGRLTTRLGGKRAVTPLFIVFAANAFALLGLRALYFLVTGLLDRLVYLSAGLALILAFIGVKLIRHWAHGRWHGTPEISTPLSLAVIGGVLVITTVACLIKVRRDPSRAHAGAVIGPAPQAADQEAPDQTSPTP